jgi:ubiquinone/menaquinone biosynthesis C-methylase UbiE
LVEDAQALSFSDETFDAVVCNLGLMFFPEPAPVLPDYKQQTIYNGILDELRQPNSTLTRAVIAMAQYQTA